jgi:hypothetical protein
VEGLLPYPSTSLQNENIINALEAISRNVETFSLGCAYFRGHKLQFQNSTSTLLVQNINTAFKIIRGACGEGVGNYYQPPCHMTMGTFMGDELEMNMKIGEFGGTDIPELRDLVVSGTCNRIRILDSTIFLIFDLFIF